MQTHGGAKMRCNKGLLFNGKKLDSLLFLTYEDGSISVTFQSIIQKDKEIIFKPFLQPTAPAYEVPMYGNHLRNTIFIRNYGLYEDAVLALIEEGVVVQDSIRDIADGIVSAELNYEIYKKILNPSNYSYRAD